MRFLCEIYVLSLLLLASGCALFRSDSVGTLGESLEQGRLGLVSPAAATTGTPVKHILRVVPDVIPQQIDDSRVRHQVWDKLCECGLMAPERRRKLNDNGFRVGVSGPTMPWALESVVHRHRSNRPVQKSANGRETDRMFFAASGNSPDTIALPEGSESIVLVREASGAEIPPDADLPGLRQISEADSVRCVLRLTTSDCSNGSALVQVLPELQFGQQVRQFRLSNDQDGLPSGRRSVPLYGQQFEVRLHPGDSVVVGHQESPQWTAGRFFFVSDSLTSQEERLLVLQLTTIETVEGQRSLQVNYSKW